LDDSEHVDYVAYLDDCEREDVSSYHQHEDAVDTKDKDDVEVDVDHHHVDSKDNAIDPEDEDDPEGNL
jgi:hypothetical protein